MTLRSIRALAALALVAAFACGEPRRSTGPSVSGPSPASETSERVALGDSPGAVDSRRIVFLGDSLTAGFGLDEAQAFPAVIAGELEARGITAEVVNAGISGDTTAGGVSRVNWVMRQQPSILVVGLGGNDGLRGLSPEMTEENLRTILVRAIEGGSLPILLGLKLPPNLGPDYVERFESVYPRLAEELDVALVPFLLEGVAGVAELNLPDGIHPTAEGQKRVAANVLPVILSALEDDAIATPGASADVESTGLD